MKRRIFTIATLFTLLFCGVGIVNSQDWQVVTETDNLTTEAYVSGGGGVIELSDGNLLTPAVYYIKSAPQEYYYSESPAIRLLSENGNIVSQNNFFQAGYCISGSSQYVFEKDNNVYLLSTYSPEHTINSFNNFANFDNPPCDAKLALFKMDNQLNIEEIYEHSWPIDTFEARSKFEWQMWPNAYSGNIFLFSAFEDEGNIVGAYWKSVSYDRPSRGLDTLFMFRMNFDGEILLKKEIRCYDSDSNHWNGLYKDKSRAAGQQYVFRANHFVTTDSCYIFYESSDGNSSEHVVGTASYYDKDFNFIRERYLRVADVLYDGLNIYDELYNISVKRSNHNTTYLTTQIRNPQNPLHDENCRLYEIDDDVNAASEFLDVINYTDRGTEEWDFSSLCSGVDLKDDNSIYYTYSMNIGYSSYLDSWICIDRLDSNMNKITTLYYGLDDMCHDRVLSINTTKDEGAIIVHSGVDLDSDKGYNFVTKFPVSAFVNIEEAHAHNLKVAVAYPNPGGDVMNIRTSLRDCTLQVYDMQGRMVHQQNVSDDVTSVDASGWKSGTYVWKLGMRNEELGIKMVEEGKWVK